MKRKGIFSRIFASGENAGGGLPAPKIGVQGNFSQNVSATSALSLSAAWACAKLISETVGAMPYQIYQRSETAGRVTARNHPLHSILKTSPDGSMTPAQFWSSMTANLLLEGNAAAEVIRAGSRVVKLKFIPWSDIQQIIRNGELRGYRVLSERREIPLTRILHITNFSLGGSVGLSTISSAAGVFKNALNGASAANTTFERGLMPTTAIKTDRVLTVEQREAWRESIEHISGAMNSGRAVLLEGGVTTESVGINPRDAQLIESRGFSVEEICRIFGVDPSLVGHGSAVSNWGTGLEQKMIGFLTFTLRPILARIEQAVNMVLLTEKEQETYYTEFNIEGLLRADSSGRANFYSTMINNGTYTRDEVRRMENLPAKGGNSDKQTIQSGFTLLETIGEGGKEERHLSLVEAVQKVYLGVGRVITPEEAREMLNKMGAELSSETPDFPYYHQDKKGEQ